MPEVTISRKAYDYLAEQAKPFVDTPGSVLDRILFNGSENECSITSSEQDGGDLMFSDGRWPSLTFASVVEATIDGSRTHADDWNGILEEMLSESLSNHEESIVLDNVRMQIEEGANGAKGFRPIKGTDFSFQGLSAERAWQNIRILSDLFEIPVEIVVHWKTHPRAHYPGRRGRLILG